MKTFFISVLLIGAITFECSANITMPSIFGDHMVLQQNSEVTFWGWGKPYEEVRIKASWLSDTISYKIGNMARWNVKVPTPKAGGPYQITIQGYNTIHIKDVLIGEVWLCSGQSNMEWSSRAGIESGDSAIRKADMPEIRFFSVAHRSADYPQIDLGGHWVKCSPETMIDFSAVAYFFGQRLHKNLQVPVGLINSSWGGTPIEVWAPADSYNNEDTLQKAAKMLPEVTWSPKEPGLVYNAMIAPLIPYNIAGTIWYQGEANTPNADYYKASLQNLISAWRNKWGADFPFYYVQIAPFNYGRPYEGAVVRDEQRRALDIEGTAMVVISDIGNKENIHPKNKIDVGQRLAAVALKHHYKLAQLGIVEGPLYDRLEVDGKKVRIYFKNAENGLFVKGKTPSDFEIAGEDKVFYPAKAKVDNSTIVLYSKEVKQPKAVRFAFHNTAVPHLFNVEGFPASAFRTDDWPIDYHQK